jgi:hypothetical protein
MATLINSASVSAKGESSACLRGRPSRVTQSVWHGKGNFTFPHLMMDVYEFMQMKIQISTRALARQGKWRRKEWGNIQMGKLSIANGWLLTK